MQHLNLHEKKTLEAIVQNQPYPLLFATLSGAHLYGFPSPDSDYDVRGVHVLPLAEILGLQTGPETQTVSRHQENLELDLVTHDVYKFFQLLLRPNGYVLEQLYSPLILNSTPAYEELKTIAAGCLTKNHYHHYVGFARTQWQLFQKERPLRIKPLLYVYRVLLTGIHLLRTGIVEANLVHLNQTAKLSGVDELLARKQTETENATLPESAVTTHEPQYISLQNQLAQAYAHTQLPDKPTAQGALHDMLIRLRLQPSSSRAVEP